MTTLNQRTIFEKLQPFLPAHLIYRLVDDITYDDALAISIHIRLLRGVIATYLPRYLSDMIAADPIPGQVRGAFKDGAVMFADISGFTAMSEELSALGKEGAEEITGIVNDYFEMMLDISATYGGDLLKFGGDALLLFFEGEGGAHWAIATGLAMQRAMSRFANIKTSQGAFALRMSIGIGSGPVFLANLGTIESMEHLVMGRALASMIQAEDRAGAGQIIVDQSTYDLTKNIAAFASAGDGFWLLDQTTPFSPPAQAAPPEAESVLLFQDAQIDTLLADSLAQVTVINGLRPFIPDQLLARLVLDPQNPIMSGAHRPVTAMFVNFYGVEEIIDTLGPDHKRAITQILNIHFVTTGRILARYGGVVNKIDTGVIGHRIMALFGALRAHEDDPQRAVRAALEMNRAMQEVNYQINDILGAIPALNADFGDAPFKQRIGINTGFVFVGNVGSATRREYSVMGDEVNLTARLTNAAEEGQILISSGTRRHVRDEFILERRPPVKLKGKSHPVDNFVVTGIRKRPNRWANLASSPIVGRDEQLKQGRAAIENARRGSGSLLVVKGVSGIGKTRLVEEIAYYAEESELDLLVGSCLSYGSTLIYHPWADILRSYFNIQSGDGMSARLDAVRQGMADIDEEVWAPIIGDVLGLEIPDNDLTRTLDAKLRRQRILDLTVKLLQTRARLTPLVVVIEDTHWADPASMDLINYVARNISYHPILLILPHRPDRGLPNWADASHAVDLSLSDLSDDAALQIVRGMVGPVTLSESMRHLVLTKGGGNPFFIEEVVRVLVDSGAFQQDDEGRWQVVHDMTAVELPDTIHGMIISRIDRLLEMDRRILQAASVIGRVFGYRLLDGTYSYTHGEPLQQRLNYMGHLGLTELQSVDASLYRFKHLTTREVVYESLSFEQRRALHRRIAAFIERTFADTLSEQTNLLAYHYFEGQEWPKAVKFNLMTARRAQREYANDTAVTSYKRTLGAIAHLDDADVTPETDADQLVAHESLGDVLTLLGQYDEALENFAAAHTLLEKQPASGAGYRHLTDLCRKTADVFEKRSQYDTAFEWLQKGLGYINQTIPTIEAARIYLLGAGVYQRQGKNEDAISWCEKSLSVASKIKTVEGSQAVGQAYYLLGLIYNRYGDLRRAIQFCAESVQVYQKIGDIVGQSQAYLNLANVYSDQGDWEMAGQAFQQSLDVKKKIGDIFYEGAITNNLANLYLYRGEWEKSIDLFLQSRAVWQQLGAIAPEAVTTSNLAQVYIYQQNWAEAEASLTRSQSLFAAIESEDFLPELERRWAEFYLKTGHLPDALSHVQRSVALAGKHDARLELGMSYRVQGMVCLARSEFAEARTVLEKSLQILSDLNSEYESARTRLMLARLLWSDSRPEAQPYLQQAMDTFKKLGAYADLAKAEALLV